MLKYFSMYVFNCLKPYSNKWIEVSFYSEGNDAKIINSLFSWNKKDEYSLLLIPYI